ncbi:unnamed protein product [Thelazia callipaeda]|uniref:Cullin domain-containing protein n=1 Tax=Thelazia callipaeda TaxID=103827 RepID=A0A0N5CMD7_THECL|nr:unnamed protein product [Thelazia callipaeda]
MQGSDYTVRNEKNGWHTSYMETFYEGVRSEDVRHIIDHEQLSKGNSMTHMTPVYKKKLESTLRLSGKMELQSQYHAVYFIELSILFDSLLSFLFKVAVMSIQDFGPKLKPCLASELIESVVQNHATTEHFEFHRVIRGHHFYEPKVDNE